MYFNSTLMIHGTRNLFTVIFLLSTTKLPSLCSLFPCAHFLEESYANSVKATTYLYKQLKRRSFIFRRFASALVLLRYIFKQILRLTFELCIQICDFNGTLKERDQTISICKIIFSHFIIH